MKQIEKYLFLIFITTISLATKADNILCPHADTVFIALTEKDYPITKGNLPVFTASIKIGKINKGDNFLPIILYPEFKELSKSERLCIKQSDFSLDANINIHSSLSFSRKEGYADLLFCPIIKKEGKYYRLSSCKLFLKKTGNENLIQKKSLEGNRGRWKKQSVLNKGRWVKIRVKQEGIYALTPSFLRQKGFDNPQNVKLYGYGGRILEEDWTFDNDLQTIDDLEEIPLHRKDDGTALFFAEGTRRWTFDSSRKKWIHENNPYSSYSYYFVTEGQEPSTMRYVKTEGSPNKVIGNILGHSVLDNDVFGWYEGGREMYDEYDFSYGQTHTFNILTPSHDTLSTIAHVDFAMSASSTTNSTMASLTHNGTSLGNLSIPKYSSFQSAYEVRRQFKTNISSNDNKFKITTNTNAPARLNFIRVNYSRYLNAEDAPYSFCPNTNDDVQLKIRNADSNTRVWRIGTSGKPANGLEGELSGDLLKVNIENGKDRFVIMNLSSSYPTPEWDVTIENQNLHGDSNAYDMIIIIPESNKLLYQAERLAQAHREDGLRVKVVNAGEIYNEFSSGTPDATAYRRYMKMLYDRAQTSKDLPRYLLLFGDCSWDNRMISEKWKAYSPKDFLLSFEVTDGYKEQGNTTFPLGEQNSYVTDDYFGWLDDNEGSNYTSNKIDLSIGRFPCHDTITAKTLVDKSIAYLNNENIGSWKNTIYVLADDGNGNLHMEDAEDVIKQIDKSTGHRAIIKKVYNDAYTRISSGTGHSFPTVTKILKEAMFEGALIFNYTGHGSPDQLSHTKILKTSDFEEPSKGNLPLWIMASCEISPYDSQKNDLGRAAFHNKQGGAIAVMCAARSVYSNYNRILNIAFNKYLFDYDSFGRRNTIGDALRLTKVEMVTPSSMGGAKDNSINKLKYILLGDPAIVLGSPTGNVILDSINGIPLTKNSKIQLKAGSLAKFSGHVTNHNSESLTDFNGSITATMTDKMEFITCKNNDNSAEEPMIYQDRTKKIFEGSDSINLGKFTLAFRIPKDISYTNEPGRITFYAVNNSRNLECNGSSEQFYLNGTDSSYSPDTLAPKVYVYLDTPDFPNGGITSPNTTFFANISDDAGINSTGIGIGHDIELILDRDNSNPINLNNSFKYNFGSYNEGAVIFPLQNLTTGKHHLSFRIWDVNGNSTTKNLDFYVKNDVNTNLDINATENPTRNGTHFIVTFHDETPQPHKVTFEVFNVLGQKVWQSDQIETPAGNGNGITYWPLCSDKTGRVPAGIYMYKAKICSEQYNKETKAKKIIVMEQ